MKYNLSFSVRNAENNLFDARDSSIATRNKNIAWKTLAVLIEVSMLPGCPKHQGSL